MEHHDLAKANMSELNMGHKLLYKAIKQGCKAAIAIAKRF